MKVTVARDGAVLGIWEREDIQAAVADGTLKLDDHYFAKGMATPLKTILRLHAVIGNRSPPTLGGYSSGSPAPVPFAIQTTSRRHSSLPRVSCSFSQPARFPNPEIVVLRIRRNYAHVNRPKLTGHYPGAMAF
jgi:hypothetical protein